MLPEVLSFSQYELVYNFLSLCIASMGAAFVFLLGARQNVAEKYRPALVVSAVVVGIACYHYFRIFQSFEGAYALSEGVFASTGVPFNDAYRYADWLLTVPLLMVEAIAVLALTRDVSRPMLAKLSIAAALMIGLGYPGEITDDNTTRAIWGTLSTIPFCYILYVLWVQLNDALGRQPDDVKVLMRNLRLLILATWGVYPIAYMFPFFGIEGAGAFVGVQVGYTIADITAKAGMGVMIYHIAKAKTEHEAAGSRPLEAAAA